MNKTRGENHAARGIESRLHQRLDVSYNDNRRHAQRGKGMLTLGIYRHLANSRFAERANFNAGLST